MSYHTLSLLDGATNALRCFCHSYGILIVFTYGDRNRSDRLVERSIDSRIDAEYKNLLGRISGDRDEIDTVSRALAIREIMTPIQQ